MPLYHRIISRRGFSRCASGFRPLIFAAALFTVEIAVAGEVEGEYEGDGYAAQVSALPNGRFHIAGWRRGLPSVAANAERIADADGARSGESVRFKGSIWTANIDAAGELIGADDQGHTWTLQRVHRQSPTLGMAAPQEAVVLFDGSGVAAWAGGRMDDRHFLIASATSNQHFESFTLHCEFLVKPQAATGSLVLGSYYEISLRDSFGQESGDESCGALLHLAAPEINASLPPGQWQTVDLDFTCARFDTQDRKVKNAVVTLRLNGVLIHRERELAAPTNPAIPETPGPGPLQLRDPSGTLRFRNIWVVEKQ